MNMKRLILSSALLLAVPSALYADSSTFNPLVHPITNPTSNLVLPAATTAYSANTLLATNASAGSLVVPSFAINTAAGAAWIPRMRISVNDSTSTAWGNATVVVDLWTAAPTFSNGDRGAFVVATGSANHIESYTCNMGAVNGDGVYGGCYPTFYASSGSRIDLSSGTSVFWTLKTPTGSGVTAASKTWTLVPELENAP